MDRVGSISMLEIMWCYRQYSGQYPVVYLRLVCEFDIFFEISSFLNQSFLIIFRTGFGVVTIFFSIIVNPFL